MMKSITSFPAWVAFAALLCFAPSAFGQGTSNIKATGSGYTFLNAAPSSFLAFTLGPRAPRSGNQGANNGCGNQGWADRGWDGWAWGGGGNNGGGGCSSVPEGGTALLYVLLAGLCCAGAIVVRSRRKASLSETN